MDLEVNKPENLPSTNPPPNPPESKPPQVLANPEITNSAGIGGTVCKRCHSQVSDSVYFCPHCGHKIKEPPYHFSIIGTISVLVMAFLFPPFGLIPAFRYLRYDDKRAKIVGILVIVVTAVSLIIFVIFIQKYLNMLNETINSINAVTYY